MATVLKVETTSADETVTLTTMADGMVAVALADAGNYPVPEESLLEAVLEYAHARGLRRTRKPKAAATPRKPKAPNKPEPARMEL